MGTKNHSRYVFELGLARNIKVYTQTTVIPKVLESIFLSFHCSGAEKEAGAECAVFNSETSLGVSTA